MKKRLEKLFGYGETEETNISTPNVLAPMLLAILLINIIVLVVCSARIRTIEEKYVKGIEQLNLKVDAVSAQLESVYKYIDITDAAQQAYIDERLAEEQKLHNSMEEYLTTYVDDRINLIQSTPEPTPAPTPVPTPQPTQNTVTNSGVSINIDGLVSDTSDVTKVSNATAEQLNNAIKASCKWMYEYNPNMGQVYADLEAEYGINAFFALAVSYSEVGVQEMSDLAKNKNNTYGLMLDRKFDTVEDCVEYFFNLIKKYYVGGWELYSIEEIATKYCPPGNPTWIKNVTYFMTHLPERCN